MTRRIGIFGTSGMALETRDIAAELGLTSLFVVRNENERRAWRGVEEVILESETDRFKDMPTPSGSVNAVSGQAWHRVLPLSCTLPI